MGPKLPQSRGMWDLDHLGESEKKDLVTLRPSSMSEWPQTFVW